MIRQGNSRRVSQKPMGISSSDIKDIASSLLGDDERHAEKEEIVRHSKIVA